MKCLDKKRIKLKGGETLALNERIMLSLVSTEVTDQFLVFVFSLSSPHMSSRNKINSVLATIYFISAPSVRTIM